MGVLPRKHNFTQHAAYLHPRLHPRLHPDIHALQCIFRMSIIVALPSAPCSNVRGWIPTSGRHGQLIFKQALAKSNHPVTHSKPLKDLPAFVPSTLGTRLITLIFPMVQGDPPASLNIVVAARPGLDRCETSNACNCNAVWPAVCLISFQKQFGNHSWSRTTVPLRVAIFADSLQPVGRTAGVGINLMRVTATNMHYERA